MQSHIIEFRSVNLRIIAICLTCVHDLSILILYSRVLLYSRNLTQDNSYTYFPFSVEYFEVLISNDQQVALQLPEWNNNVDSELPTALGTLGIKR